MLDNASGMNMLYSSYIYFWTAYRGLFLYSKMLMLRNILRLKSGSFSAHLFAYQEVRVTGLLGVIVVCS